MLYRTIKKEAHRIHAILLCAIALSVSAPAQAQMMQQGANQGMARGASRADSAGVGRVRYSGNWINRQIESRRKSFPVWGRRRVAGLFRRFVTPSEQELQVMSNWINHESLSSQEHKVWNQYKRRVYSSRGAIAAIVVVVLAILAAIARTAIAVSRRRAAGRREETAVAQEAAAPVQDEVTAQAARDEAARKEVAARAKTAEAQDESDRVKAAQRSQARAQAAEARDKADRDRAAQRAKDLAKADQKLAQLRKAAVGIDPALSIQALDQEAAAQLEQAQTELRVYTVLEEALGSDTILGEVPEAGTVYTGSKAGERYRYSIVDYEGPRFLESLRIQNYTITEEINGIFQRDITETLSELRNRIEALENPRIERRR